MCACGFGCASVPEDVSVLDVRAGYATSASGAIVIPLVACVLNLVGWVVWTRSARGPQPAA
jgi:hypothetical protein